MFVHPLGQTIQEQICLSAALTYTPQFIFAANFLNHTAVRPYFPHHRAESAVRAGRVSPGVSL